LVLKKPFRAQRNELRRSNRGGFKLRTFGLIALAMALCGRSAQAQDTPPPFDNTVKGAALCVRQIYLAIEASPRACGWQRQPVDDAIDKAVHDVDDFILANSSEHPTRQALEKTKQLSVEGGLRDPVTVREMCRPNGLPDFIRRFTSPDHVALETANILSIPREPLLNPCLQRNREARAQLASIALHCAPLRWTNC
jgi:hypothetical protein